jgi:hypothetical protein
MADQAQLNEIVNQLNAALGDVTPYKLAVVPPADIQGVEKNAHYMPKRVYDQLRANVERDKNLSSLPFCWRKPDGSFVALSGNHRSRIAAEVGVPLVMILYTDEDLSRPQQVAIQLSHNSLVGLDNPTTLRELWDEVNVLDWKIYTGLDDGLLKTIEPVAVTKINEEPLRFEEMHMLFLTPEIERIEATLKALGASTKKRLAAQYADFDRFFETLLTFKEASGIVNSATAFMAMIEIVEAWITEHYEAELGKQEKAG